MPEKRKTRAAVARRRASEMVLLGGRNGFEDRAAETLKQQAAWLVRRVCMSPELASAVAELAFDHGRLR